VILPDVDVLVYAFRRESVRHKAYADWLAGLVAGADELALNDQVLGAFVRIVTNRRIYADSAPAATALAFVDALRAARRARWLPAGGAAWERLGSLVAADRQIAGNLMPDAVLAAVALAHGCRLATADRGFARFPALRFFDPAFGGPRDDL
jgi:toxin-antitoxin system PIN domain toxin